jgi:hypothetical protein
MTGDTRSYAVPTETIPGLELSHHLRDLSDIRIFFESRDIETRNTRIERYGNYLERSLSGGALEAEKYSRIRRGNRPGVRSTGT